MKYRHLQITFSAVCGAFCLLLIVMWVRSYYWVDQAFVPITRSAYVCLGSMPNVFGVGFTDQSPIGTFGKLSMPTIDWLAATSDETGTPWSGVMMFSISADGVMMPYWFGVLLSAAFGTTPWLRWRFSLRTLLIATTLIAVALGLIFALSR